MNSQWRKSSYSDANGGDCVEVATSDAVLVRDTASREGVTLSVTAGAWAAFLSALR
jgi:hypothetical protein